MTSGECEVVETTAGMTSERPVTPTSPGAKIKAETTIDLTPTYADLVQMVISLTYGTPAQQAIHGVCREIDRAARYVDADLRFKSATGATPLAAVRTGIDALKACAAACGVDARVAAAIADVDTAVSTWEHTRKAGQ